MRRCYVYFHRRVTDRRIFYIGRGRGERAWSKGNRTREWYEQVEKHCYTVEIAEDNLEPHEAVIRECQYMSVYNALGEPLVNKNMVLERRNVRDVGRLNLEGEPCYCFRLITTPFMLCATIDTMVTEHDVDWDEINELVDGEIAVTSMGWVLNEK